jgi:arginyl-tRNA synthetase
VSPALLDDLVRDAASQVLAARGLDLAALPADAAVGRPHDRGQGEYATAVALRTAGRVGVAPRELAGWVADALAGRPEVASAETAGAGFVNLTITAAGRAALVREALTADVDGAAMAAAVARVRVPHDLVAAVGIDAARYATLRATAHDRDLLTRRVPENPLFRVQYAHARAVALLRNAADLGVSAGSDPGLLTRPREVELVGCLAGFPAAVRRAAPHRLARHLEALADAVLDVHDTGVLPRGDEATTDLHRARLAAVAAARRVLATGLGLLGVSAPDRT